MWNNMCIGSFKNLFLFHLYIYNVESLQNIFLFRHGQSVCNARNSYCGWINSPLTEIGEIEVRNGLLEDKVKLMNIDKIYVSNLIRTQETASICVEELNLNKNIIECDWRLNEQLSGVLTGLNKITSKNFFGNNQIRLWRRSLNYKAPGSLLGVDLSLYTYCQGDFLQMNKEELIYFEELGGSESFREMNVRVMNFWNEKIILSNYKNILIIAHGNVIRGILHNLKQLNETEVSKLEIERCKIYPILLE
jgi:2,3-bisphosphoglycerate-dependent phosphoglycerate mutase